MLVCFMILRENNTLCLYRPDPDLTQLSRARIRSYHPDPDWQSQILDILDCKKNNEESKYLRGLFGTPLLHPLNLLNICLSSTSLQVSITTD